MRFNVGLVIAAFAIFPNLHTTARAGWFGYSSYPECMLDQSKTAKPGYELLVKNYCTAKFPCPEGMARLYGGEVCYIIPEPINYAKECKKPGAHRVPGTMSLPTLCDNLYPEDDPPLQPVLQQQLQMPPSPPISAEMAKHMRWDCTRVGQPCVPLD